MSVFKQLPRTHVHVRTPIMIGLIVLLVVLLSAFCYYHTTASGEPRNRGTAERRNLGTSEEPMCL